MEYITPQILVNAMHVNKGETLLIASDVQRLCWGALQADAVFDFQQFIHLLQKEVGVEGTLLFPTYNWGFCHGTKFDYYKTKSLTGSLSQIALERKDFVRTRHPLYSFAVWGKDAKKLYEMDDANSFVGNTPFAYLHKKENAKMITIDVDLTHCFTFVHYVEEINKVPYRFLKKFTAGYINENQQQKEKTYSMYVRDLSVNGIVDFSGLEKMLLKKKLIQKNQVQYSNVRAFRFFDTYAEVENDIKNNQAKNIVRLE